MKYTTYRAWIATPTRLRARFVLHTGQSECPKNIVRPFSIGPTDGGQVTRYKTIITGDVMRGRRPVCATHRHCEDYK